MPDRSRGAALEKPGEGWEQGRAEVGAKVRVRPKPPALGMVWHNEQQHLPAPTEPVPGFLPLFPLPGLENAPKARNFWGAMQSFWQQLTKHELLQSCCGGKCSQKPPHSMYFNL